MLKLSNIKTNTTDHLPATGDGDDGLVTSNFKDVTIDFSNLMNYNNGGTSTAKMTKAGIRQSTGFLHGENLPDQRQGSLRKNLSSFLLW